MVALSFGAATLSSAGAQNQASVGVDADPNGNTATSLGELQHCRRTEVNDSFDVDVYALDLPGLEALQFTLIFDPAVLQITSVNDSLMIAANDGSQVISLTDNPAQDKDVPSEPDDIPEGKDGSFIVAAADFSHVPDESGSGVLARVSLKAIANGVSSVALSEVKLDRTNPDDPGGGAIHVGPVGYDNYFVGTGANANIGVGADCSPPPPTALAAPPSPPPTGTPSPGTSGQTPEASDGSPVSSPGGGAEDGVNSGPGGTNLGTGQEPRNQTDEGSDDTWIVVVAAVAGVALVTAAGAFLWARRRRA